VQDSAGDFCGEGLEFVERAAGGDAGLFQERRVEDKGAAVHEGMVGGLEWFAEAARGNVAGEQFFIKLQIGLKIEGVAGGPFLLFRQSGEKFAAKEDGILAQHGFGFTPASRERLGADDFEGASSESEGGFAAQQCEKVAIKSGMNLESVAAVFDDVGIDEAWDDTLATESFGEAQRKCGGGVESRWFFRRHVLRPW